MSKTAKPAKMTAIVCVSHGKLVAKDDLCTPAASCA